MKRLFAPLVAALVMAAGVSLQSAMAQAPTDPLVPARSGQLQCYAPDVAHKSCQSLAGYNFDSAGAIDNVADTLIMPSPAIVMRTHAPVTVRDGAVCGAIRSEDLAHAEFTIDGASASAEQTQEFRARLTQQMAPILGVDVCTTFVPVDGSFRADASFDGTPRPELSQSVIWVRPDEGYSVAP